MSDIQSAEEIEPTRYQRWRHSSLFLPSVLISIAALVFVLSTVYVYYHLFDLQRHVSSLGGRMYEVDDAEYYRLQLYRNNTRESHYRSYYVVRLEQLQLEQEQLDEITSRMQGLDRRGFKLDLIHSKLPGIDLTCLQETKNLTSLDLTGTQLTDDQLSQVAAIEQLRILDLSRTSISEAGLKAITRLPDLFMLRLDHVALSEDQLMQLGTLKSLRVLSLTNTDLSEDAINKFSSRYTQVEISDD